MIGRLISQRYLVESLIGSGGMANVYKATDTVEKRTVALKVLKDEHKNDAEFVRRFEMEARAVLSLSHENIVSSYDVGQDGDVYYIVLEYVEGSTLKEIIKAEGSLSPSVAVNIASQVLDALACAHEKGIIHRDVKPQNVIITPRGKAKLTDFGIARDAAATTRTFAGANAVLGSVHYISPEQARGEIVGSATDIYSCAIMLYEMLTGQVPFGGDNTVAIALKHLQEDMIPPNDINHKVPRALSDVVMKAAGKNPSDRYPSARQMKADIKRALKDPRGKFVRNIMDKTPNHRINQWGVLNIALILLIVLGVFTALFFISRSLIEENRTSPIEYIIPTVEGKSLEEARGITTLRGFELEIEEYRTSEESEGTVLSQDPAAGTSANPGDSIFVAVSSGSGYVRVPNLVSLSVHDAADLLYGLNLSLGTPQYVASDLPSGQIVRQEPAAETDTFEGDIVDIWVSGQPGNMIEMPSVTDMTLDDALAHLKQEGISNIRIIPVLPEGKITAEEYVVSQNPTAKINITDDSVVELNVCRSDIGEYSCDIAFNLEITEDNSSVAVTVNDGGDYETLLYEAVLSKGLTQGVSFTAHSRRGGQFDCMVYVNGELVRITPVTFSR